MIRVMRQHTALPATQHGAVVLLLLLILAVSTASYFLVKRLNSNSLNAERAKFTAAALAQAKQAVLGFAMTNQTMPGGLPFPDRAGDGNYDGKGDCYNGIVGDNLLLGKLPSGNEEGCFPIVPTFDASPLDSSSERLWYAVSRKLIRSSAGSFPVPTNTTTLMVNDGWLTVRDETGTPFTNLAAFILVAPGEVLQGQDRTAPVPAASNFLDNFTAGATLYSNWNGTGALGFIMSNPVNNSMNRFNDRLLYVTRDEFVNHLVLRIVGEIRSRLDRYHNDITHNQYPFAAPVSNGECVGGTISGFIPITDALPPNDCGGSLALFPPWWIQHKWQDITHYTRLSGDQAAVQFDSCLSIFTITWNAALNRSEIKQSNPC